MRGVDIGMAEPRRLDLDANLAGLQRGSRHLLDAQRRVELVDDGGPVGGDRLAGRLGFGGGDSHPSPSAEVVSTPSSANPQAPSIRGRAVADVGNPRRCSRPYGLLPWPVPTNHG